MFKLVFEARLRTKQLEKPAGRPSAQPLFIVCFWRLRSKRALGLSREAGRVGLLALSPGACALGGRSSPLPLCVRRVWNNVSAQRS